MSSGMARYITEDSSIPEQKETLLCLSPYSDKEEK